MIIYADITFIINFLMTLAIIWVVGHLQEFKISWWRLSLAALLGTLYTFIVILLQFFQFPFFLNCFLHLFSNLITAFIIIKIAYPQLSRKKYLKGVAYLYLVSFITIGTTLSLFYIYGGTPFNSSKEVLVLIGLIILVVLGKVGWHLFQNYLTPEDFYLPVRIFFQNRTVELIGLVDTGNSLNDPLTNAPVLVVNLKEVLPLFPLSCQEDLINNAGDGLELINTFSNNNLGNRVRLLPFSDLGQEHGILIGFRPDEIELIYQDNIINTDRIILALSRYQLDQDNQYQALVHPQIIKLQV